MYFNLEKLTNNVLIMAKIVKKNAYHRLNILDSSLSYKSPNFHTVNCLEYILSMMSSPKLKCYSVLKIPLQAILFTKQNETLFTA